MIFETLSSFEILSYVTAELELCGGSSISSSIVTVDLDGYDCV